jgi:hypothetical protein
VREQRYPDQRGLPLAQRRGCRGAGGSSYISGGLGIPEWGIRQVFTFAAATSPHGRPRISDVGGIVPASIPLFTCHGVSFALDFVEMCYIRTYWRSLCIGPSEPWASHSCPSLHAVPNPSGGILLASGVKLVLLIATALWACVVVLCGVVRGAGWGIVANAQQRFGISDGGCLVDARSPSVACY